MCIKQLAIGLVLMTINAGVLMSQDKPPASKGQWAPYPTLNPPAGVTPAQTRGAYGWSLPRGVDPLPRMTWTPEERQTYERRTDWFHQAKYGLSFHYLCRMARQPNKKIGEEWQAWDDEKWNAWVNEVDVEKAADQAKELGAGYVVIALGQSHPYFCAPNPVIERLWQLKPGQYASKRDLPMDLAKALEKRGIPMMLYIANDKQYGLPRPDGFSKEDAAKGWIEAAQWYSDHYGKHCKGWWLDGLNELIPGYRLAITKAVKHGNPDALVASGSYEISDFVHGHCITGDWNKQRHLSRPFFGRWDPDFNIQWHAFQPLGVSWAASGTHKQTADVVNYAVDIVKGGGVITFDVGIFEKVDGKWQAPFLEVPPDQFEQLKAVRDALKNIPVSDGRKR